MNDKTCYIYDMDDTLFFARQPIGVKDDQGVVCRFIEPHEYDATVKEYSPDRFCFNKLMDMDNFAETVAPNWLMINQCIEDMSKPDTDMFFMTARHAVYEPEKLFKVFREHGIEVEGHRFVFASANKPGNPSHLSKLPYFNDVCKQGYNRVVVYDDSITNLQTFHEIRKDFPNIKFEFWHVQKDGTWDDFDTYHSRWL